ncbi:inositol monophosphatase 1-like [Sarcoptes scabiei]|nr:inositol monophosphatase 1-like [Sarcoptes scabiei]
MSSNQTFESISPNVKNIQTHRETSSTLMKNVSRTLADSFNHHPHPHHHHHHNHHLNRPQFVTIQPIPKSFTSFASSDRSMKAIKKFNQSPIVVSGNKKFDPSTEESYRWIRKLIQTRLDESKYNLQQVEKSLQRFKKYQNSKLIHLGPLNQAASALRVPSNVTTAISNSIPSITVSSIDRTSSSALNQSLQSSTTNSNSNSENQNQNSSASNDSLRNTSSDAQQSESSKNVTKIERKIIGRNRSPNDLQPYQYQAWKQLLELRTSSTMNKEQNALLKPIVSNVTLSKNNHQTSYQSISLNISNTTTPIKAIRTVTTISPSMLNNQFKNIDNKFNRINRNEKILSNFVDDIGEDGTNIIASNSIELRPRTKSAKLSGRKWKKFRCPPKTNGFFADLEYDCQFYYHCSGHRHEQFRFRCPDGTRFNERNSNCDWEDNVDCHQTFDLLRA